MDLESQSKAGRPKEDKRQAGWSMTEVMHMEKWVKVYIRHSDDEMMPGKDHL